jgi:hypothetical protein
MTILPATAGSLQAFDEGACAIAEVGTNASQLREPLPSSMETAMSNTHNAGPDDETSDADADAETSDASAEAEQATNENAGDSAHASVAPTANRSATNPVIVNH